MLDELDEIDWAKYNLEVDVPQLLRDLSTASYYDSKEILSELGDLPDLPFSEMLPFLHEILLQPNRMDKENCLMYLLASSGFYPFEEDLYERQELNVPLPTQDEIDALHLAHLRGLPKYFQLLDDDDPGVHEGAAECVRSCRGCDLHPDLPDWLVDFWLEEATKISPDRLPAYADVILMISLNHQSDKYAGPDRFSSAAPAGRVLRWAAQTESIWGIEWKAMLADCVCVWDENGVPLAIEERLEKLGLPNTREELIGFLANYDTI